MQEGHFNDEKIRGSLLPKLELGHTFRAEDLKEKLLDALVSFGYPKQSMLVEGPLIISVDGRRFDLSKGLERRVVITKDSYHVMVIEIKTLGSSISWSDWCKLETFTMALCDAERRCPSIAVLTNGQEWLIANLSSGMWCQEIPSFKDLKMTAMKLKERTQLVAVRRANTMLDEEGLVDLMRRAESIIRSEGFHGASAFTEFCKLLLVKVAMDRMWSNGTGTDSLDETNLFQGATSILKDEVGRLEIDVPTSFRLSESAVSNVLTKLESYFLYEIDLDVFGIVYENFFADEFKGQTGKFFTPREIVNFMVDFADIQVGETIMDPTCGSGGFLVKAVIHLRNIVYERKSSEEERSNLIRDIEKSVIGNDIDPNLSLLTKINLEMHGNRNPVVHNGNAFRLDIEPLASHCGAVDVILANPPFSVDITDQSVLSQYEWGRGRSKQISDYLFVELAHNLLKPGGRMLIVLPYSMLSNKIHQSFRNWLYDNWIEVSSISLPEGVFRPFGGSSGKTCIIYIRKRRGCDEVQSSVLKVNIPFVGYDHTRTRYRRTGKNDFDRLVASDTYIEFKKHLREEREKRHETDTPP